MLAYTAVSKLLLYPTLLSAECGRDLLFPALFDFILQTFIVWAVCFLSSKTDKTFFELIKGTLGQVVARVVYGLFGAFFLIATLIPLLEQKLYVHAIFYDTIPSLMVFLPVFFFLVYAGSKGLKNIGRCADICMPIFVLSALFILVTAFIEVKWDNFLPVFKTPVKTVFGASLSTLYRFMEPCWLLMFLGHFKYRKNDTLKITLSYAGGAIIVLMFLFAFYGVYGEMAQSRQFAVSKISIFFPAMEMLGRIDLVVLYVLETVMLFALVLNIQLAAYCFEKSTGFKNRKALSAVINGILLILVIALDNKFNAVSVLYAKWMWIAFILFANLLPLAVWLLKRRAKK